MATNVGIILTGVGVESKNLDINLTSLDLRKEKEQSFLLMSNRIPNNQLHNIELCLLTENVFRSIYI